MTEAYLENLALYERKPLDRAIGRMVNQTLCDPRTRVLADAVSELPFQTDAEIAFSDAVLDAGLLYVATASSESRDAVRLYLPNHAAKLVRVGLTPNPDHHLIKVVGSIEDPFYIRGTDLLLQAVEDAFLWFDMIRRREGLGSKPKETLTNHPSIFAAIGLKDKLHRTVVAILGLLESHDELNALPHTRNEFIELFSQAPEILKRHNTKIEGVDLNDQSLRGKGLCPAAIRDESTGIAYIYPLLDVTSDIYLARHRR